MNPSAETKRETGKAERTEWDEHSGTTKGRQRAGRVNKWLINVVDKLIDE